MDYFELAKGITTEFAERLQQERRIAELLHLVVEQDKVLKDQRALINEQRELIELLKTQVKGVACE